MQHDAIGLRARSPDAPVLSQRVATLTRWLRADLAPGDPRIAMYQEAVLEGDPLADALVEWLREDPSHRRSFEDAVENGLPAHAAPPLAALFADVERVPAWVDRARLRRGGEAMQRHGLDGMTSLSGALMGGYLGNGATKPLVATGALVGDAAKRLARTTSFVVNVATSGELGRFSAGFKDAIRVRVMHASVRRQLAGTPGFPLQWGVPISQRDMVATHLQFTITYLLGTLFLGRLDKREEWEDVLHLWRYVSHVLGVRDALLPGSVREALEVYGLYNATEPGPDADGRALAGALIAVWTADSNDLRNRLVGRFLLGYSRYILGDHAAEQLGIPDTGWKRVPLAIALLRLPFELRQLLWSPARKRAQHAGRALLELHSKLLLTRPREPKPSAPGMPALAWT